jgi:RNA polymerase sigma factor (sigma-70 family)
MNARPDTATTRPTLDSLAARAKSGDPAALDAFLEALTARLGPFVGRQVMIVGRGVLSTDDADDVLQQVVISAWQVDLGRWQPARACFLGFLSRRVRWIVRDAVRRRVRAKSEPLPEDGEGTVDDLVAPEQDPEAVLAKRDGERTLRLLPALVDELAEDDGDAAHAVRRSDLDEECLAQIALELEVDVSTACRARQRGLRWLQPRVERLAA